MVAISVIVCTYNQEATIARALDAILAQQCSVSFELIIGEDASTDGTRKICEEYAKSDKRIKLYRNEKNS
jgi:glucosyltransferase